MWAAGDFDSIGFAGDPDNTEVAEDPDNTGAAEAPDSTESVEVELLVELFRTDYRIEHRQLTELRNFYKT